MNYELEYKNKLLFILFFIFLLTSCSQKNSNFDIDLSNLPKPKPINKIDEKNEQSVNSDIQKYIKDLIPFKKRKEITAKFKSGKNDPFSETKLTLDVFKNLKLTGFLNTDSEKYVFVSYLGNKGTISMESIGGLNTNLLPDGAKVRDIDIKRMKLIIDFKNKEYFFEL